ncbi:MAG: hypothetical protein FJX29_12460 [Alphaproteobacteria bacterium]|nr:hypothetical protein [Alphaproteobacteria bacterium]
MIKRDIEKLVHGGEYVAKVRVALIENEHEWYPAYPLDDVLKLDRVRKALEQGDIESATKEAEVFQLKPVAAE